MALRSKKAASIFPSSSSIRIAIDETLDIGEDTGTPVSADYQVPFKFTGNLKRVLIRPFTLEPIKRKNMLRF